MADPLPRAAATAVRRGLTEWARPPCTQHAAPGMGATNPCRRAARGHHLGAGAFSVNGFRPGTRGRHAGTAPTNRRVDGAAVARLGDSCLDVSYEYLHVARRCHRHFPQHQPLGHRRPQFFLNGLP